MSLLGKWSDRIVERTSGSLLWTTVLIFVFVSIYLLTSSIDTLNVASAAKPTGPPKIVGISVEERSEPKDYLVVYFVDEYGNLYSSTVFDEAAHTNKICSLSN